MPCNWRSPEPCSEPLWRQGHRATQLQYEQHLLESCDGPDWRMRLSHGRWWGFLQKAKIRPEEKGKLEDSRRLLRVAPRERAVGSRSEVNALLTRRMDALCSNAEGDVAFLSRSLSGAHHQLQTLVHTRIAPLLLLLPSDKWKMSARNAEHATPISCPWANSLSALEWKKRSIIFC